MADDFDLAYAIKLPNDEAIDYFRARTPSPTLWNWGELLGDAHAKSFVVAKAVRGDVLGSIHRQMRRAVEKGISEAEFVRNLEINLKKLGWWGKQVIVDPDGGAEVVQLGSPHRLRTIYRTNMEVGVAHGAYRRQVSNAANRPYWKYVAILDSATRPTHAAMNGKVFPADDPIWKTHYPPNGFGCRCFVMALTAADLEKDGLAVSSSEGDLSQVPQQAGVNKRTGEVIEVRGTQYRFTGRDGKPRTMTPDPGWSYNPGYAGGGSTRRLPKKVAPQETLANELADIGDRKLEAYPPAIARAAISDLLHSPEFDSAVQARTAGKWPVAVISDEIEDAIRDAGTVTAAQIVTSRIQQAKLDSHPEVSADRFRLTQDALDYGELLIEVPGRRKQGDRYTLIAYYEDDGWWRHVIHVDRRLLALRTLFRDRDPTVRVEDVLTRNLIVVRNWDAERWERRPTKRGK